MLASNAAIIDLSNLNVLFRYDGRFTTALNYSGAVDRLGPVLAGLGPGYDVFLCLKPRATGEGDYTVQELSLSSVPFEVDAKELLTVLQYFRACHGVNEVYLCNWLNNYIEKTRTDTFESAFYYGDRVAKIVVEDKLVRSFELYDSVIAFTDAHNDAFDGYGDFGLIDVDGFRAQFPEFSRVTKVNAMVLAPLAHCCSTQCIVNVEDIYEALFAFVHGAGDDDKGRDTAEPEDASLDEPVAPKPLENYNPSPEPVTVKVKGKTPFLAGVFLVASFLLAIALGATFSYVQNGSEADYEQSYYDTIDQRVTRLQRVIDVYSRTETATFDTVSAYDYALKSEVPVSVVGFERRPDSYLVRCNCASEEVFAQYVQYIEERYTFLSQNDLGIVMNGEEELRQFSVMFS